MECARIFYDLWIFMIYGFFMICVQKKCRILSNPALFKLSAVSCQPLAFNHSPLTYSCALGVEDFVATLDVELTILDEFLIDYL